MNTRLFALVLAGATTAMPVLAQTPGKSTPPAAKPAASTPVTAPAPPASNGLNGVAADVNGDKIYVADLNRMVDSFKANDPSLRTNTPEAQKIVVAWRKQRLDYLIERQLLLQESKRQKITIAPADVDKAVAEVKKSFKTDAEFQGFLKDAGKSEAEFRRTLADQMAVDEVSTRLTADVTVSNDDIATYYRAHLDQFTVPEGIKARHILLAVNPNAPQADKDRVKQRAVQLIAQLKKGAKFEDLAKVNSDDPGTKDKGGDLGAFPRGVMVKAFEDAAFAAKAGDIVGPIETDFGFHIIRIDQKIPAQVMPITDVQKNQDLKFYLMRDKVEKKIDDFVAALRAKSKVQVYA